MKALVAALAAASTNRIKQTMLDGKLFRLFEQGTAYWV
jgi:hypothetical protein